MLAERGFGGIGLTAREIDTTSPRALCHLLAAHGLVATSLNSAAERVNNNETAGLRD
jgi:hypothetical protein